MCNLYLCLKGHYGHWSNNVLSFFFFSKDILKEFFKCALVVFLKSRFKKTVLVENIILIK